MKKRIYSDEFVDRVIAKVDAKKEKCELYNGPFPFDGDFFKERPWLVKELDTYIQFLKDRAFVQGFWDGYSLKSGIKD